jgi:hypothetical protein
VDKRFVQIEHQALPTGVLWSNGRQKRFGSAVLIGTDVRFGRLTEIISAYRTDRDPSATVLYEPLLLSMLVIRTAVITFVVSEARTLRILR